MRNLAVLFIHLVAVLARLLGPGGGYEFNKITNLQTVVCTGAVRKPPWVLKPMFKTSALDSEYVTRKLRIDRKLRDAGWKVVEFDSSKPMSAYERCAVEERSARVLCTHCRAAWVPQKNHSNL